MIHFKVAYACAIFCIFYVIRHVLHVFNLCTGGLNQTKVQLDKADSIDTQSTLKYSLDTL